MRENPKILKRSGVYIHNYYFLFLVLDASFDKLEYNMVGIASTDQSYFNIHFLPRLIKDIDSCFPTA